MPKKRKACTQKLYLTKDAAFAAARRLRQYQAAENVGRSFRSMITPPAF
jgi:hypothetical protein